MPSWSSVAQRRALVARPAHAEREPGAGDVAADLGLSSGGDHDGLHRPVRPV